MTVFDEDKSITNEMRSGWSKLRMIQSDMIIMSRKQSFYIGKNENDEEIVFCFYLNKEKMNYISRMVYKLTFFSKLQSDLFFNDEYFDDIAGAIVYSKKHLYAFLNSKEIRKKEFEEYIDNLRIMNNIIA